MGITDLVTGGFGDLGQAAGAGLNEYTTQMDYDKLAQFVNEAMQRGVPPQQAAQQAAQAFPGLMGGQGGGQPPQRPGLQVPSMTQPNVVPNTIGPSSPVQGGGMGSLGAPQGAPPQQPYPTVGQTSPLLEQAFAAGDATRSQPRPLGTEPRDQTPLEYPETPGAGQRLPQRQVQQTSAAPSQAPQRGPAQGMGGLVTPRNLPLFQVLMQRQAQKDAQQTEMRKVEETAGLRRDVEGMKEQGRNARAGANIASREAVAQLNAGVKTELGQVKNDTDVLRILTNRKNVLDALGAKAELAGDDLEFRKQKSESDNGVLKVLAGVYQASMNAAANMPAKDRKAAEERARLLYERGVDAVTGMRVTGGETVTTPTPGVFGTGIGAGEKKTTTPLGVTGPTKPVGAGGGKTVVKTETNKRTGQKRYTYSDGTTEVK